MDIKLKIKLKQSIARKIHSFEIIQKVNREKYLTAEKQIKRRIKELTKRFGV